MTTNVGNHAVSRRVLAPLTSILLAVLVAAALPFLPGSASAAQRDQPQASEGAEPIVARVYYDEISDLASLYDYLVDVHEYNNRAERYVLAGMSMAVAEQLRADGWQVTIDPLATEASQAFNRNIAEPGLVAPSAVEPHAARAASCQNYTGPWEGYRCVADVETLLADAADNNATIAELIDYGDSHCLLQGGCNIDGVNLAGHDLLALRIANEQNPDAPIDSQRPSFVLIGAVHARELSTTELAMNYVDELLAGYGTDPDITWLIDWHNIYVVPVANPDGRWVIDNDTSLPSWQRKNARETGLCAGWSDRFSQDGVDLNRNSSFGWGDDGGSSANGCSLAYRGGEAHSEPETEALEDFVRSVVPDQRANVDNFDLTTPAASDAQGMFISLHSYGNFILYPWGSDPVSVPDAFGLQAIGAKLASTTDVNPQDDDLAYESCQLATCLYQASGTTDDWAYGELGIPSFTYEIGEPTVTLPDGTLTSGFFPPFSEVGVQWDEIGESLSYASRIAREPYALAYGPDVVGLTASADGTEATASAGFDDSDNGGDAIAGGECYLGSPYWADGVAVAATVNGDASYSCVIDACDVNVDDGQQTLWARGQDDQGNWGPVWSAWVTITGTADCGSEPPSAAVNLDPPAAVPGTTVAATSLKPCPGNRIVPTTSAVFSPEWYVGGDVDPLNIDLRVLAGTDAGEYTVVLQCALRDELGDQVLFDYEPVAFTVIDDPVVLSVSPLAAAPGDTVTFTSDRPCGGNIFDAPVQTPDYVFLGSYYAGGGVAPLSIDLDVLPNAAPGVYTIWFQCVSNGALGAEVEIDYEPITFVVTDPSVPQSAFNGPHNVPGLVQAEDFDLGGQDVAFNEATIDNLGGAYRDTAVDVYPSRGEDGFTVGHTRDGEWLEYTVTSDEALNFEVAARVASGLDNPGSLQLDIDGLEVATIAVEGTNGWWNFDEVSFGTHALPAGDTVVRVTWLATAGELPKINFDRLNFEVDEPSGDCGGLIQEAEDGLLSGSMVVISDGAAAAGAYVQAAVGSGGHREPSINFIEFCVDVPVSAEYRLDARVLAPNSRDDSFYVAVGGGLALWDVAQSESWIIDTVSDRQVADPFLVDLAAGEQTVRIYQREDGTSIDFIELVAIDDPGPTCDGPNELIEAESGTVSGTVVMVADETASGGVRVEAGRRSVWPPPAPSEDYLEICVDVPAGASGDYRIDARVLAPTTNDNSFFVMVDSGAIATWDIPFASGWQVDSVKDRGGPDPAIYSLGAGNHILRFFEREDGPSIDTVTLVPVN